MTDPTPLPSPETRRSLLEDALINLSHELRTPLAAIKGYTTSVIRHERRLIRAERQEMLREIVHACTRMETLIDHTLHAAQLLQGDITLHCEPITIVTLTRQAINTYVTEGLSATEFTLDAEETDLVVWGDAGWLARALAQLLDNAARYAPAGSAATVTIRRVAEQVEWSITDQGIGIRAEDVPLLFTPFYRVERQMTRETSGLGLGLALCQRIIDLHGGAISVTSTPGVGSRFCFTLPLLGHDEKD